VYNFAGKLVKTVTVNGTQATVDISTLADGVYIIQGNINGALWHSKYVKQ
jgi:hypothetical protein